MITKHHNQLNMYKAVCLHLNASRGLWSSVPMIVDALERFTRCITRMEEVLSIQTNGPTQPMTEDKEDLSHEAFDAVERVASAIRAWACLQKNGPLAATLKMSRSRILRQKRGKVLTRLRAVLATSDQHLAESSGHTITAEDVRQAGLVIDRLEHAMTNIDNHRSQLKEAGERICKIVREARECLVLVDWLLPHCEGILPEYLAGYRQVRCVRKLKGRHGTNGRRKAVDSSDTARVEE